MDALWFFEQVRFIIPLVLSLTVHEWAHAYSAYRLGDDTALRMGRLTLNPLPHIDPIGTLLLPLLGVPFGWARPVPVNPTRFHPRMKMRTGMMITAAAGPFSNLVLAVFCIVLAGVLRRFELHHAAVEWLLLVGFQLNIALAVFNMLPIPPLDGSRVAEGLLPARLQPAWDRFARFGPLVLLAVILLLPRVGINLLSWPLSQADHAANSLLRVILTVGT
jgi:Zn-dependent protease